MRALLVALCVALDAGSASAARLLVFPVTGDVDGSARDAVSRAIETGVRDAATEHEIMTLAALQTSLKLGELRDCIGDEFATACMSEIADAAHADAVVAPQLSRLGDELLLTITISEGGGATLLSQVQRRVAGERPSDLLDVIPSATRQSVEDAGLLRRREWQVPVAAVGVGVGGAAVAVLGTVALAIRGAASEPYAAAQLPIEQARAYELYDQPALYGGIIAVAVGGVMAIAGAGVATYALVGPQ